MIPASALIAQDLATLEAELSKPVFAKHDRVIATLGPTTIVGEVVEYQHVKQACVTVRPDLAAKWNAIALWADDGWVIEHVVEVP